jgi:hypothetical protein
MINTLLLTAKIKPDSSVNRPADHLDPNIRYKRYMGTLLHYIWSSEFDRIVFCDSSGIEIPDKNLIDTIASKFNKKIERLLFQADEKKTLKYGYHYGEAEIFDYAYENSKFLQQATNWRYKITWRYIINNITDLIKAYEKYDRFLYKWWWLPRRATFCTTTAFFKMDNKLYEKYIYRKQLQFYEDHYYGPNRLIPLEWIWYYLLREHLFVNQPSKPIVITPEYHFQPHRSRVIQPLFTKLGFSEYGKMGKLMDILFFKYKARYVK